MYLLAMPALLYGHEGSNMFQGVRQAERLLATSSKPLQPGATGLCASVLWEFGRRNSGGMKRAAAIGRTGERLRAIAADSLSTPLPSHPDSTA